MSHTRTALIVLLSALLLAGCASTTDDAGPSTASSGGTGAVGGSDPTAAPPAEPPPQDSGGGGGSDSPPSVVTITAPGGNATLLDEAAGSPTRCVVVDYLNNADDIPAGVTLAVLEAEITDGDGFAVGGSGCAGHHLCAGSTLDAAHHGECSVPITEQSSSTDDRSVTFKLPATVRCAGGEQAVCADYAQRAKDDAATFSVSVPGDPTTGETTSATTSSSPS